jgi:CheY-like chemotaxis protein
MIFVKLLDSVTKFLQLFIWPGLILVVVVRLGPKLGEIIASFKEFSVKAPGLEATWKTEAAAALAVAAVAPKNNEAATNVEIPDLRASVAVVEKVTPQILRLANRSQILWVDDRPNNNVLERRSLEALGVQFTISTSTEDAITRTQQQRFDIIISDMGRPPDPKAGYTLLDRLRASGNQTPFIIYAGSRASEHQIEAKSHGAIGCINRADELFNMVLAALAK